MSTRTLSIDIRKKISTRVICGLFLLFFGAGCITVYDLKSFLSDLKRDERQKCEKLSLFIIGQKLVRSDDAIAIKLNWINRGKNKYQYFKHFSNKENMSWSSLFSWTYSYPVNNIDHKKFGTIKVSGSILNRKQFTSMLYERLALLAFFLVLLFYLLYPLSHKIPEKIFLSPIKKLLSLLKNNDEHCLPDKNQPQEIYQIQYEIIQLMEQLKKQSKEAAIGQITAQVAHDIRSPLMSMSMMLQSVSKQIPEETYKILNQSIQNIRDIANNLLTRYKESGTLNAETHLIKRHLEDDGNIQRYVLLSSIIDLVLSQKHYEWQGNPCKINVSIDEKAKNIWLFIAPNNIKRMLSNLLNNAYESLTKKRQIDVNLILDDQQLKLSLADSGKGISIEETKLVLMGESFKSSGSGLGLSTARKNMEILKGTLNLVSNINQGTTVTLTFPIPSPPSWLPKTISLPSKTPILFLDDDPSMHNLWRVQAYPTVLEHFTNSKEVIHWYQTHPKVQAIFLFDYELRHDPYNGLELLEKINPGKRGYLITSHAEELVIQERCAKANLWLIQKTLLDTIEITSDCR